MTEFRAESKKLLDLMIHSIYTHKEIFLRELISNASDALDKRYFQTHDKENLAITIAVDKEKRLLTVSDNGIGMTREELEENLGTIARSGSLDFKKENGEKDGLEIIGQFGVGFYSAFMAASEVTVKSRKEGSNETFMWYSTGVEGYTVTPAPSMETGTVIELLIKKAGEEDEEDYDSFLESYKIESLVKKYSDFIRYPIIFEGKTLNSMVPLWRKNKNELSEEDYNGFFSEKHYGSKPLRHIHMNVDGAVSYTALLYIPSTPPFDFYTRDYEKGLELYANGVMIMQKCADLLPDHYAFVQGLVDSADLSLNISRELLQHDRQLKHIAKRVADKIHGELLSLLRDDREKYDEFFNAFGRQLKYGVYAEWGSHKDELKDLLIFYSSTEKKKVTLAEYISRIKEGQEFIYYAAGASIAKLEKMPQTELLADKGFEILYFTDDVDEFAIKMLGDFEGKHFANICDADLDVGGEKEESKVDEEMYTAMGELLSGKVVAARVSSRLKSHPVCLTAEGGVSVEMERILSSMPGSDGKPMQPFAKKYLEINPAHPAAEALRSAFYEKDEERFDKLTKILYNQALLIEGLNIEDPVEFANNIWAAIKQ